MILSCVLFAVMANLAFLAQMEEPQISTLALSGMRIFINLLGVILVGLVLSKKSVGSGGARLTKKEIFLGDGRSSLWWRGVFGAVAMIFYFAALRAIGAGESTFLQSSNSIFIAILAPMVLKQKNSTLGWLAVIGSAVGLFLLLEPRITDNHPFGRWFAVGSGLCSALAYLMIAKAGRSNRPETVVFYFCLVGTLLHLALMAFTPLQWPRKGTTWMLLIGTGFFGTLAQLYLTSAYQLAPAALAGAVSYLQPVLNTLAGVVIFSHPIDFKAWCGAALIAGFGVVLPFVIRDKPRQITLLK